MSKNKANKTYIKVEMSLDSKEQLKKRAQEEGYNTSEYCRQKLMDSTAGKDELIRKICRFLPSLYDMTDCIDDRELSAKMRKELASLWQSLK